MSGPSKRCLIRSAVGILALAGAAGAAWRALRLPHDSDDWVHSDAVAR